MHPSLRGQRSRAYLISSADAVRSEWNIVSRRESGYARLEWKGAKAARTKVPSTVHKISSFYW